MSYQRQIRHNSGEQPQAALSSKGNLSQKDGGPGSVTAPIFVADMRFIVHFKDGETVQGRPLGGLDTGWNSLSDKPISRLVYVNPFGDMIVLQGYEEYNHMVECLQPMGGRPYITDVYLMGARDGLVTVYRLRAFQDTSQDAVRVGDVTVRVCPRGKEYLDSETWGWRRGLRKV